MDIYTYIYIHITAILLSSEYRLLNKIDKISALWNLKLVENAVHKKVIYTYNCLSAKKEYTVIEKNRDDLFKQDCQRKVSLMI